MIIYPIIIYLIVIELRREWHGLVSFESFNTVHNATEFCQDNHESGLYSPTLDDFNRIKRILLNIDYNPGQKNKYWWTGFVRYKNGDLNY